MLSARGRGRRKECVRGVRERRVDCCRRRKRGGTALDVLRRRVNASAWCIGQTWRCRRLTAVV
eukprot:2599920-Pleurochrysis_carterae.AAC.1